MTLAVVLGLIAGLLVVRWILSEPYPTTVDDGPSREEDSP